MNNGTGWLVWSLIQISAVGLLGALVSAGLGRRRPAARAATLATTLAAMLVASGLALSPWSRWYSAPLWLTADAARDSVAASSSPASWAAPAVKGAASTPSPRAEGPSIVAEPSVAAAPQSGADELPAKHRVPRSRGRRSLDPTKGVLLVIGLGIAACLAWWAMALVSLAHLRARSREVDGPRPAAIVAEFAESLQLRRPVAVRVTSALLAPATVGWLRPVIYLPATWLRWSDEELRTVLAHELAHVSRQDYLSTLTVQFCRAGTCYHPGAWWLAAQARLEQELATDACAATLVGGSQKYLLNLARLALGERPAPAFSLTQAFLPQRRALLTRVRSLESGARDRRPVQGRISSRGRWLLGVLGLGLTLAATGLREPWTRQARAATAPPTVASDSEGGWLWNWAPAGSEVMARLGPADLDAAERQQIEHRLGLTLEQLVPWDHVTGLWIARHPRVSPGASTLAALGVVLPGDPVAQTRISLNITSAEAPSTALAVDGRKPQPVMTGNISTIDVPTPPSLLVMRSREPIAWARDNGLPPGDWRRGTIDGRRYWYLSDTRGMTTVLALVDERTIALADPRELSRIWGKAPDQPAPAWAGAWQGADIESTVLAAESGWIVTRLRDHRLPGPLAIPAQLVETMLRGSSWCLIEKPTPARSSDKAGAAAQALKMTIGFDEPIAEVWAKTVSDHARRTTEATLAVLEHETAALPPESRARWAEEAALARQLTIDNIQVRGDERYLEVELSGPHLPVVWSVLEGVLVLGPIRRSLPVLTDVYIQGTAPEDLTAAQAQRQDPAEVDVLNQQLSFVEAGQVAAAREASRDHLRRIGEAIQAYVAEHGEYPRTRFDEAGNPLLSWRVMVLPYLGEGALYAEFHLDEPWNSLHNRRLLARRPEVYQTPRAGGGANRPDANERTGYGSPYGSGLLFDGDTPRRPADLTDGPDQTIFAYQGPRQAEIPWTEPTGFYLDNLRPEEVDRFRAWIARATDRLDDTAYNVLLADGSVRGIARNVETKTVSSLLSIAGNDRLNLPPLPAKP